MGQKRGSESSEERREQEVGLEERIGAVTEQLQMLEVGVAESNVMLSLASHFDSLEAERCMAKMEMRRVKDENDWLREELEDTERRLEEALSRLAVIEEEKQQWLFMEQVRRTEQEADLRPVTPSKIPVGSFRVEEEKAINRALSGIPLPTNVDSNRQKSPPRPHRRGWQRPCTGPQAASCPSPGSWQAPARNAAHQQDEQRQPWRGQPCPQTSWPRWSSRPGQH